MEELLRTQGFTGKDIFNLASATKLSDQAGKTLKVTDLIVVKKPDKDGIEVISAGLKAEDGTVYATISQSVIGQLNGLAELLPCDVKVVDKKSNGGRTYYQLELV